jgi:type II secretory pathway pseudopilin PulG
MTNRRRQSPAFTLLEVFIVLVILSTMAALVITSAQPGIEEQLRAAGRVAAADLDYARDLAVTFNSSYRVTFDAANNRLVLQHSGSDTTLNALPPSPNRSASDPADQQILRFDALAGIDQPIRLWGGQAGTDDPQPAYDVEFGPLGETTRSETTTLWLTAGAEPVRRYLAVEIDPVTGLTRVGQPQSEPPPIPQANAAADEAADTSSPEQVESLPIDADGAASLPPASVSLTATLDVHPTTCKRPTGTGHFHRAFGLILVGRPVVL